VVVSRKRCEIESQLLLNVNRYFRRYPVVPTQTAPVINSAVRLVFSSSKFDHITPLLHHLHWLKSPVQNGFSRSSPF